MEEFPGNSRINKPVVTGPIDKTPPIAEVPKLEKVVSGKVIRRKKSLGRRLLDTFMDPQTGVFGHVAREVLIPALQEMVVDTFRQGLERAVFGEVRSPSRGVRGSTAGRPLISYNNPTTVRASTHYAAPAARRPTVQPSALDLGEIVLDSQINAQVVIDGLFDTVEQYGAATVANLKELTGETALYTDHKYGWRNLEELTARRVHGGYLLVIPQPEDLGR